MPGKWWVFDTNVYVTALREGMDGEAFGRLIEASPRTYLAAVVSAELYAGVRDEAGRRAVLGLKSRFARVGRIVVPSADSWNEAGQVLGTVARREPKLRSKVRTLWNDLLIALCARQIGATLVTNNVSDFALLSRYVRFDLDTPGLC